MHRCVSPWSQCFQDAAERPRVWRSPIVGSSQSLLCWGPPESKQILSCHRRYWFFLRLVRPDWGNETCWSNPNPAVFVRLEECPQWAGRRCGNSVRSQVDRLAGNVPGDRFGSWLRWWSVPNQRGSQCISQTVRNCHFESFLHFQKLPW